MGCGCLLSLIIGFMPRLVLGGVWLTTGWVEQAFGNRAAWPLLGLAFLPFTSLAYVLAYSAALHGPTDTGWLVVGLALLIDVGSYGGHAKARRRDVADRLGAGAGGAGAGERAGGAAADGSAGGDGRG